MVTVEGWYQHLEHGISFVVVDVWDGRNKVGFMQGFLYPDTGTAEVALVELDSEYHGQGIGKRMYREFIDAAFRAGAQRVRSDARPSVQAQHVWMSLDKESPKVSRVGPTQWEVVPRRPNVRRYRRSK